MKNQIGEEKGMKGESAGDRELELESIERVVLKPSAVETSFILRSNLVRTASDRG